MGGDEPPATVRVELGYAAQGILDAARGHDSIVMATSGRTGLTHFLIGSVAEKVGSVTPPCRCSRCACGAQAHPGWRPVTRERGALSRVVRVAYSFEVVEAGPPGGQAVEDRERGVMGCACSGGSPCAMLARGG